MSRISRRLRYLRKQFRRGKLRRGKRKVRTGREMLRMALRR